MIIAMNNKHQIKSRRDDMIIEDDIFISPLRGFAICGVRVCYNNLIPSGLKLMVQ